VAVPAADRVLVLIGIHAGLDRLVAAWMMMTALVGPVMVMAN
jgi:hypothetical protein